MYALNHRIHWLLSLAVSMVLAVVTTAANGQSYNGMNAPFAGIAFTNLSPCDPVVAVGTTYVLQALRASYAVYDKSGNLVSGPTTFAKLFGSLANNLNLVHPKVIYDQYSQRWVMILIGWSPSPATSVYLIAASKTSDPTQTSGWYTYSYNAMEVGNNGGYTPTGYFAACCIIIKGNRKLRMLG